MEKGRPSQLEGITPASIERYMLSEGWMRTVGFPNPNIMVFHRKSLLLVAPATEDVSDYHERLHDFVVSLSLLTKHTVQEIINYLKNKEDM